MVSLQLPPFKHGLFEHGLESVWQAKPILNWLHWQIYCCLEFSLHVPWLEQLAKHDDKSLLFMDRISFSWFPALFISNIDEASIDIDIFVEENKELNVSVGDI